MALAQIKTFKKQATLLLAKNLLERSPVINGCHFIAETVPLDLEDLQLLAEELSSEKKPYLLALAIDLTDKCHLVLKVSKDLQAKGLNAGALIKKMGPCIEGSGGGKADSAQAGGKNSKGLPEAFLLAKQSLESIF